MKLILISSHLVDIQGREHYSGDLIYAINNRLHCNAHEKIPFKLDVMIGLTKPYVLILV